VEFSYSVALLNCYDSIVDTVKEIFAIDNLHFKLPVSQYDDFYQHISGIPLRVGDKRQVYVLLLK